MHVLPLLLGKTQAQGGLSPSLPLPLSVSLSLSHTRASFATWQNASPMRSLALSPSLPVSPSLPLSLSFSLCLSLSHTHTCFHCYSAKRKPKEVSRSPALSISLSFSLSLSLTHTCFFCYSADRLRVGTSLGGVPREQKIFTGHLPRVIYHQVYFSIRRKTQAQGCSGPPLCHVICQLGHFGTSTRPQ